MERKHDRDRTGEGRRKKMKRMTGAERKPALQQRGGVRRHQRRQQKLERLEELVRARVR